MRDRNSVISEETIKRIERENGITFPKQLKKHWQKSVTGNITSGFHSEKGILLDPEDVLARIKEEGMTGDMSSLERIPVFVDHNGKLYDLAAGAKGEHGVFPHSAKKKNTAAAGSLEELIWSFITGTGHFQDIDKKQ